MLPFCRKLRERKRKCVFPQCYFKFMVSQDESKPHGTTLEHVLDETAGFSHHWADACTGTVTSWKQGHTIQHLFRRY